MARINTNQSSTSDQLFDTEIPDFSDYADIQAAFRMYHYGGNESSAIPAAAGSLSGVAGYLEQAYEDIALLNARGIGSTFSSSAPTGTSITAGHIWVDSSSSSAQAFTTKTVYASAAPTENLFDGLVWIEKGSSPLAMYVYDVDSTSWKEIGA